MDELLTQGKLTKSTNKNFDTTTNPHSTPPKILKALKGLRPTIKNSYPDF